MKVLGFVLGAMLGASTLYGNQVIDWNYNNQAKAGGNGCNSRNTDFISAGNEISVIFSDLGVNLTTGSQKVARKVCRIVIPTSVRKGYYMANLTQLITYGYNRTEGTEGKIVVSSRFYNQRAGSITAYAPSRRPSADPFDEPFAEARQRSRWLVRPGMCSPGGYKGNFISQITVNGYRKSKRKQIILQVDGQDIKFIASGYPLLCPR